MDLAKYRQTARRHVDGTSATQQPSTNPIFEAADLDSLQSADLYDLLEDLNIKEDETCVDVPRFEVHEDIVILDQFLQNVDRAQSESSFSKAVLTARGFTARAILPNGDFAEKSPYDDDHSTFSPDGIAKFHHLSLDGLDLLSKLCSIYPTSRDRDPDFILLIQCAASFTDASDVWTCESSRNTSLNILDSLLNTLDSNSLSTTLPDLLRECIKPAFAAGRRNPAITPEGRRAIYDPSPADPPATITAESAETTSPWKYRDVYVVTVLQWIIQSLAFVEAPIISQLYPSLTPAILTLIDDPSPTFQAKGIKLLTLLLPLTPPQLLSQTGLGDVFEQNLILHLAHLPPLTTEKESLSMLKAVYPALISLARARYPHPRDQELLQKALGRVMKQGILAGYAQASEYVQIADFFTTEMGILVVEIGMGWVYYLKRLLPLLSANLSSPFALTYPPLLLSTLATLQTIILTAWPRIPHYRFDILTGLTVCWCRIADEGRENGGTDRALNDVRWEIQKTVNILTATLKHEKIDVREEYGSIVEDGDKRLAGLLIV